MTEMCNEVRDALALEGRVADDDAIQKHLDECSECAQFLKSLTAVESQLGALSTPDVADQVVDELLARVPSQVRSSRYWLMGLAAAATVAFVTARFLFLTAPKDLMPAPMETAEQKAPARFQSGNEPANLEAPVSEEDLDALRSLGYISGDEVAAEATRAPQAKDAPKKEDAQSGDRLRRIQADDKVRRDVVGGKLKRQAGEDSSVDVPEGLSTTEFRGRGSAADFEAEEAQAVPESPPPAAVGGFLDSTPQWRKLVHVDPVFPPLATRASISGNVILRIEIDPEGNVSKAEVAITSNRLLEQAAIDAVLQWKYEPVDGEEMRETTVRVEFKLDEEPKHDASLSILEERARVDGVRFKDARGYWANSYIPGDPKVRYLELRLRKAQQQLTPHFASRPIAQPFDAPERGALSVYLRADRRGLSEPSRLLVQVGLKATEHHGRRRPPMNVGIVLDTGGQNLAEARALMDALREMKALGDRFRLILPGQGEVVSPESFRHGPLALALEQPTEGDLVDAVRLAMTKVHAGDDPTMPLGTSLVLLVTSGAMGEQTKALTHLAHQSAVGGVPVSVVGIGDSIDRDELERFALAGQGRRYFLERSADASRIVEEELAATSRAVARALRLRIKLAPGVKLVDVLDSQPLSERQADRVREAEKSIDLRLSRNLGIEADRGDDEDGIQIVIPSFYAGDTHTVLLDVVAQGPGPIAEVTLRYKDLAELENTVAKASLALPQSTATNGPLETNVLKNYLALHLSRELESAADALERADRRAAAARLEEVRSLLAGLSLVNDREVARDIAMLTEYMGALSSSATPVQISYLVDSLRYAGATKIRSPAVLT